MDKQTLKPKRLAVVSLRASDLPATVHFYRDVVGLSMLSHHAHHPAFDLGNGCFLVMVKDSSVEAGATVTKDRLSAAPFPAIAFAVDDLDRMVEHLGANGVELPWGIESGVDNRWVKFYDPSGNLIEFAEFE